MKDLKDFIVLAAIALFVFNVIFYCLLELMLVATQGVFVYPELIIVFLFIGIGIYIWIGGNRAL